ncbi:ATP-dependent helicase [Mollicutes bacterium LVI A0078]|nr:ATP-dependent helicase [Mollicutes bacterium LVI A0075]WOO90132.1 ATP-dependent helicase [Mollicutes bacterium LVI A0078]
MLNNITKVTTLETEYDYLQTLNYDQQVAATQMYGNQLVLAGPGTGKTHTLAYRAMHLIKQGVEPNTICLITFTRKAANSLRERIEQLMPGVSLGFIGTFHALATSILSDANHLNTWRLIDTLDDLTLIEITCKSGAIGSRKLQQIFSYYINTKKPMDEVLTDLGLEKYLDHSDRIAKAYEFYANTKARLNYLTYDDLLLMPIKNKSLMTNFNIEYLMVDEFQDVTKLQVEFTRSLRARNVMVIGDDFQNIYRFRGSDNQLILDFGNTFVDSRLITLSTNYRSTVNINSAINQIVEQTNFGYPKYVISSRDDQDQNAPVNIYGGLEDSTSIIIDKINNDPYGEHAILYRRSKMRANIEQVLIQNNIPYQIYGGLNLLEREHIKDLLSIISLINNPNDYLAHIHVLRIGDELSEKEAVEIINNLVIGSDNDVITRSLIDYRLRTINQTLDLAIDYYIENIAQVKDDPKLNADFGIIRNLAESYPHILAFLNDFTLDYKVDFKSIDEDTPRVILSTIHASKGLEFDNVHILYGFNKFKDLDLKQLEEEARLFYVAMSRAKNSLNIYDNFSKRRSLNDMINDFIDSPLRENFELKYDDEDISDVEKITLHLDQDDLENELEEENLKLGIKTVLDFFRK